MCVRAQGSKLAWIRSCNDESKLISFVLALKWMDLVSNVQWWGVACVHWRWCSRSREASEARGSQWKEYFFDPFCSGASRISSGRPVDRYVATRVQNHLGREKNEKHDIKVKAESDPLIFARRYSFQFESLQNQFHGGVRVDSCIDHRHRARSREA